MAAYLFSSPEDGSRDPSTSETPQEADRPTSSPLVTIWRKLRHHKKEEEKTDGDTATEHTPGISPKPKTSKSRFYRHKVLKVSDEKVAAVEVEGSSVETHLVDIPLETREPDNTAPVAPATRPDINAFETENQTKLDNLLAERETETVQVSQNQAAVLSSRQPKLQRVSSAFRQLFSSKKEVAAYTPDQDGKEYHGTVSQELAPGENKQRTVRSPLTPPTTPAAEIELLPPDADKEAESPGASFKRGARDFRNSIAYTAKRFGRCLYAPWGYLQQFQKRISSTSNSRDRGTGTEEYPGGEDRPTTDTAAVWNAVSIYQMQALYGSVQASTARCPRDKLRWLEAVAQILLHQGDRYSLSDPLRTAALDGNTVLTCLQTLEDACSHESSAIACQGKKDTLAGSPAGVEHFVEKQSQSPVLPNNIDLTRVALWLLQDLCLNEGGVDIFAAHKGPAIVIARLKSLDLIRNAAPAGTSAEEWKQVSQTLWLRSPQLAELLCLKASYRLMFASCIAKAECSDVWVEEDAAGIPLATLNPTTKFTKDASYVGLALGVLRVLAAKPSLSIERIKEFVAAAAEMLLLHPTDCWVVENAFAIIATGQEKCGSITGYLKSLQPKINPWELVVSRCRDLQKEGHVLLQGFKVLRLACLGNKDIIHDVKVVGGETLVDCVLPEQRDIYVEKLLPVAIDLKQLFSPVDFETSEIQTYLRSGNFGNTATILEPEADAKILDAEDKTTGSDLVVSESNGAAQSSGLTSEDENQDETQQESVETIASGTDGSGRKQRRIRRRRRKTTIKQGLGL